MTMPLRTVSLLGVLTALVLGVVLLVGVFEVPIPAIRIQIDIVPPSSGVATVEQADATEPRIAELEPARVAPQMTLIPGYGITSGVSILNLTEVLAAIRAVDAEVGGTARVRLFVDFDGTVQEMRLSSSSGRYALDSAAMSVAEVFRFSPAMNRDQAVGVWVTIPITFQARSAR